MTTARFFNIEYAALPTKFYGITNTVQQGHAQGTRTVQWVLNSHPLTDKFVKLHAATADNISYNFYLARTPANILKAKCELNLVIEQIQQLEPSLIDNSLKVNAEDYIDVEHDKLNELHFIFEKHVIIPETQEEAKVLLDTVNSLVHYIEQGTEHLPSMLMVYRQELDPEHWIPLESMDYSNFKLSQPGQLMLDFATVGKDLYHAWSTNDQELVRRGEVKPQEYCTASANILIENTDLEQYKTFAATLKDNIAQWVNDNNLDSYIDINAPQHALGRHVLGEPVDPAMSTFEFWEDLLATTPCVTRIYIS